MAAAQYDPTKVTVDVGGHTVRGYADGNFIEASHDNDKRSKHVGADGGGRHVKMKDRSGTVTITVTGSSASNDAFDALDRLDQPFSITATDKTSDAALFFADSCTLQKVPDWVRGKDEVENAWVFQFINGEIKQSGSTSA